MYVCMYVMYMYIYDISHTHTHLDSFLFVFISTTPLWRTAGPALLVNCCLYVLASQDSFEVSKILESTHTSVFFYV